MEQLRIDVDKVLKSRMPRYHRFIPRFVVRWLERLICQDEMNALLEANSGKTGADFARGVLDTLNIRVKVKNESDLPDKKDRRVIFVSNHPLGGLDGLALIAVIQQHYGGQVWFIVNDLLMAVEPLKSVFLPVNKISKPSRRSLANIEQAFAGNDPIIIFPAGMVSRLRKINMADGYRDKVCDLRWRKSFVTRAIQSRRDVIPLHFSGRNSMDFYRKAALRKKLGIKFNIEMILLPREMMRRRGETFTVTVGERKPWDMLEAADAQGYAESIASEVFRMGLLDGEMLASDLEEGRNDAPQGALI